MNLIRILSRLLFRKRAIPPTLLLAIATIAALSIWKHLAGGGHVLTLAATPYRFVNAAGSVYLPIISQISEGVPPEPVTVQPSLVLDGQGENVDSIAFWEAPDPAKTTMYVTAKDNRLVERWQYPFAGHELPPLQHQSFGSGARVNGVAIDQERNRLYVSVAAPVSTVAVFSLPQLTFVDTFIGGAVNLQSEPNVAILNHANGQKWLYVSSERTAYIHNAVTGAVIGLFDPVKGLETMVADNFHQVIYIPDESDRTGIYAYKPDGTPYERFGIYNFGRTAFDEDAEGIIIYTCPADGSSDNGTGFIVVADQRNGLTDFEFFDRQTWVHRATLNIDGISNTDGIGSTQRPLPGYPRGVFAAVDDDTSVAVVGWDVILSALNLSCPAAAAAVNSTPDHTCHPLRKPE